MEQSQIHLDRLKAWPEEKARIYDSTVIIREIHALDQSFRESLRVAAVVLLSVLPIAQAQSTPPGGGRKQAVTHLSGTVPSVESLQGTINASLVTVPGASTPDIGQKVSQAFLNLQAAGSSQVGTVYIPAGTYSFSHTMTIIPGKGQTGYRETLVCDPSAILNYTGSGDAFFSGIHPAGIQEANVRVFNCEINGNSSVGANGFHFSGFYGIYLENVHSRLFSKGSGFYFDGAGVATAINCSPTNDRVGVYLTGNSSTGTAPNAIHWLGGSFQSDGWGWKDATVGRAGYSYGNIIDGAVFEGNGHANAESGDIDLQNTLNTTIQNSYFEASYGKYQILIDSTAVPQGSIRIIGNELDGPGPRNADITTVGRADVDVEGNNTANPGAYFVNGGTQAHISMENNRMSAPNTGQGAVFQYPNKYVMSFTTSPKSSDTLEVPSLQGAGFVCSVAPLNSTAAGFTGVYIPLTTESGKVVVHHPATAGAQFAVYCATPQNQ
jgi:hypothetical protein